MTKCKCKPWQGWISHPLGSDLNSCNRNGLLPHCWAEKTLIISGCFTPKWTGYMMIKSLHFQSKTASRKPLLDRLLLHSVHWKIKSVPNRLYRICKILPIVVSKCRTLNRWGGWTWGIVVVFWSIHYPLYTNAVDLLWTCLKWLPRLSL